MTPRCGPAAAFRPGELSEMAAGVYRLSLERWGASGGVLLIGRHRTLLDAQTRMARFAGSDAPVLLTGETGTGKELFARGLYLLGSRCGRPFVRVNCAQFHDGNLMASELFGHKKGSFTGAVADHRGLFEEANGGVIFLDEIGELSLPAQAMLLRALSEGEIVPVGGTAVRQVDVRVIAATSRDLRTMIAAGTFREDLFYRLRCLWVRVPALRERGADWELVAGNHLARLSARADSAKTLSREAVCVLRGYPWPGNVRELKGMMDMGYALADGAEIGPQDLMEALEQYDLEPVVGGAHAHMAGGREPAAPAVSAGRAGTDAAGRAWDRLAAGGCFWEVVREPFMERELSRAEVRCILQRGLAESHGSYKRLLRRIGVAPEDYLKFMDFLRHHRLKPDAYARSAD